MKDDEREKGRDLSRRELLWSGTGVGMGIAVTSLLVLARDLQPPPSTTPEDQPIKAHDLLVFAQGPDVGSPIGADQVPRGGPQTLAWPMDPETRIVKSGRSLNRVLLVRAAAQSWFSAAERAHTAAEVAAYSATCTHLCCDVSDWAPGMAVHGGLLCPCHRSHFDPWDGARVLNGPAPRPLPILPIEADSEGQLRVAGGFLTHPGCRG